MAILFTSDLHLGHRNIISTCGRNAKSCGENFSTVEEMNSKYRVKYNKEYVLQAYLNIG